MDDPLNDAVFGDTMRKYEPILKGWADATLIKGFADRYKGWRMARGRVLETMREAARYRFLRDSVGDKWNEAMLALQEADTARQIDSIIDKLMDDQPE